MRASPVLDESAEEAARGRQIKGGAQVAKGVWPGLECDDLDVEEVGELNKRHLTCRTRGDTELLSASSLTFFPFDLHGIDS